MSGSTGRIVGAIAGFAIGGPQGAMYGYQIGAMVDGPQGGQDQQGPRLSDLKLSTSAYGNTLKKVSGRFRTGGEVIWALDLIEVETEESSGGKGGGPTTTTYEYFATFAVAVNDGEIDAIAKIWANNELIYNVSDTASVAELQASNQAIPSITIYRGSETQLPDPLIQADQGIANTQAYRGTSYIVFERMPVGDYGNRLPNIEVEVIASGTVVGVRKIAEYTINATMPNNPHIYSADSVIRVGDAATLSQTGTQILSLEGEYLGIEASSQDDLYPIPTGIGGAENLEYTPCGYLNLLYGPKSLYLYNKYQAVGSSSKLVVDVQYNAVVEKYGYTSALDTELPTGFYITNAVVSGDGEKILVLGNMTAQLDNATHYYVLETDGELYDSGTVDADAVLSGIVGRNSLHSYTNLYGAMYFEDNYQYVWTARGSGTSEIRIAKISGGVLALESEITGASGVPDAGNSPDIGINVDDGVAFIVTESDYLGIYSRNDSVSYSTASLSSIVSGICQRAGLLPSEIDTSDLTDQVEGYVISQVMTARAAIEPLRKAFFFDAYEDGSKLVFKKRGGTSVASITEDELGASTGQDAPYYQHVIMQEAELPSKVTIGYADIDHDYQIGMQQSQRIDANVENTYTEQLPIAMSGDKSKQVAEVLHYNVWTEKEAFSLSLSNDYLTLNPTDIIDFTVEGVTRIARITGVNYGSLVSVEAVSEDVTNYVSTAQAGDRAATAQSVSLLYPTKARYLDIPMLQNSDNGEGVYLAAAGYNKPWSGCVFFRSSDGVDYTEIEALATGSKIGTTTTVLADAYPYLMDRVSTVDVVMPNESLSSVTEEQALAGANTFLIGDEIIRAVNVTDNGNDYYTLDTLIRGRRGTEWATDTHAVNERVVLLSRALDRIDAPINSAYHYKAVTFGLSLSKSSVTQLTNTGVSQKPFSVHDVAYTRDGSATITLTWLKRSRYIASMFRTLPMFEDSEAYEIDVINGSSVLRTLYATSETVVYTDAQQVIDFGESGTEVIFNIYQISEQAGRGNVTSLTVAAVPPPSVGDFSTATLNDSKTLVFGNEQDVFVSGDGINLYRLSNGTPSLDWSTFATGHDIQSTLTAQNTSSPTDEAYAIWFSSDGTKYFVADDDADTASEIRRYDMTAAFDPSTASLVGSAFAANPGFGRLVQGISLNSTGTKMLLCTMQGGQNIKVRGFTMTTAFDLSTATLDSEKDLGVAIGGSNKGGMAVYPDGSTLLVLDGAAETVHQFSMSTPFDESTLSLDETVNISASLSGWGEGVSIALDSGTYYIYFYTETGNLHQFIL